ncbi:concanavalin A-like lectin/glucanase domain-containing protein [Infundibulicybe gibba]|nr:concanavalin A-like lectin/glucanase domain-containing protein [Infundibulicybe gibba]
MKSLVFVLQLAVLLASVQAAPYSHKREVCGKPGEGGPSKSSPAVVSSISGAGAPASTSVLGSFVAFAPTGSASAGPVPGFSVFPTEDSSPQPTRDSGPQPTEGSDPQPTRDSGPQPTEDSGPQPTRDSGPQPIDSVPQPIEDSGPQPTRDSSPQPIEDSDPQPTDSDPQPTSGLYPTEDNDPQPTLGSDPQPIPESGSPSTSKNGPQPTPKSSPKSTSKSSQPAPSSTAPGPAPSPGPGQNATCGTYVIKGQPGGFTNRTFIDFSGVNGGDAAAFLAQHGMTISNYQVGAGLIPHTFIRDNVALGSGTLDMKVSSYSGSGSVQSAEILTQEKFKYGSMRTVVKSSPTPGVCEGFFTYAGNNQESDWEILTSTTMESSGPAVPAGIWATNQALSTGGQSTSIAVPVDSKPSDAFHELQLDWYPGSTTYLYDGVQRAKHTTNVPNVDSNWIINAWSDGNKNWSAGPPTADSITQIRSILIYNGYTTDVKGTVCDI